LPTTAGVGVGEETALEADTAIFGGVAGFTEADTDAIGLADADIFGGVAGFTDPDTDAIGLPVFASQHLDSLHNPVLPIVHLTSIATSCFDGGHLVNDEQ
jgi:hypothetical protein